ncbi:site-specific DNA-methyltransferase [Fodinibius sp. SL11]|uniref:site-specific DNA-methyltransferase n=1 Tax=Fodinibius sp. SL11 TaxID=3425690 RepID=UPI003F884B38
MSETVKDYMPETPDINQERLELLKDKCPDWFTEEGKLDLEEIKKAVDADNVKQSERFEFTWFGKAQAKRQAFTPSNATLKYDKDRSESPEKANGNLIIEGENLEVLKLLRSSYREKIDCIYIDPPYNTGKDFVYSDNYSEDKKAYWEKTGTTEEGIKVDTNRETQGRFHSNWLSMMYSRLLVARQLLSPEGLICISIDETEVANLRKLLNEVFGEENYLETVIWKKRNGPPNDKRIGAVHEYILLCAKDIDSVELNLKPRSEEQLARYSNPDNHPKGPWTSGDLMANVKGGRYVESLYYPIENPETGEKHYPSSNGNWRYNQEDMQKLLDNDEIYFGQDGEGRPKLKRFLCDVRDGVTYSTLWDDVAYNNNATSEMADILGNLNIFDTPKPTELLMEVLRMGSAEDSLVMDFFAGSGSLAHATMKLNKEEDSNRRYIIAQLPESVSENSEAEKAGFKKVSDITIERNKRVIKGYGEDPEPIDSGFKVYTLAKSNFPRVEFKPDPEKSQEENVEALKDYINEKESSMQTMFNEEDIIDEVLLKNGFMLDYSIQEQEEFEENKVYLAKDDHREALICLDGELHEKTVEHFKGDDELKFICLERALDTSKKWNLKNYLGDKLNAM